MDDVQDAERYGFGYEGLCKGAWATLQNTECPIRFLFSLSAASSDLDVVLAHGGEGLDEGFGQTDIGVFRK